MLKYVEISWNHESQPSHESVLLCLGIVTTHRITSSQGNHAATATYTNGGIQVTGSTCAPASLEVPFPSGKALSMRSSTNSAGLTAAQHNQNAYSYPLASHALVGWHLLKILKSWFLRLSNVACSCFLQILIIWSDIALLAIKGLVINAAAQHSGQHHHDVRALNATSYGNRPWTKRPPSRLAAAVALYIPIHKWGPETSQSRSEWLEIQTKMPESVSIR